MWTSMPSPCGGVPFSSSSSSSSAPPLKSEGILYSFGSPCWNGTPLATGAWVRKRRRLHTKVHRWTISRMSRDENWCSFLLLPNMTTATSTEQSTESS